MLMTSRLMGYLNRVWDTDPEEVLALRLQYAGTAMLWRVQDGILTTEVAGGAGVPLVVDLAPHTIQSLVDYLGTRTGYTVAYYNTELRNLSALILLDGSGNQAASNGDHITAYSGDANLLWPIMEAFAAELAAAEAQIPKLPAELATTTADGEWLDQLGEQYGVPRLASESDAAYGPRIIAEVIRPRGNNVAIEDAIRQFTGQACSVADAPFYSSGLPVHNSSITYNSANTYSATSRQLNGLFNVSVLYDPSAGLDATQMEAAIRGIIERFRDVGTQLGTLTLTTTSALVYNGLRRFNEAVEYQ